ncbi:MAG TPA: DMT family transporter [Roseiarcus sp.]|nr:DMT family transporter [Roseiarcus sp.]
MTQSSRPLDRVAIALMLTLCASWGLNQIAAKVALADVPPITQSALRSIGATLAVSAVAAWREPGVFRRDKSLLPGLAAGLIFGGEFIALYLGVQWTSAGRVIVFLYSAPFFVALGVFLFVPQERLRALQWLGMALAFAGVVVALFGSGDRASLIGDLLAILGAAGWGAVTVMTKATSLKSAPPTKVLLYQLAISALLCAVAAYAAGEQWPRHISALSALSLAYQTFWVAGATYLAWFWLLKRYRAGELSAFTFLTPIVGVFAGHFLLGEKLSSSFLAALAMVAGGILLANWPVRTIAGVRLETKSSP